MLDELMKLRISAESWGVTIPTKFHPNFAPIPVNRVGQKRKNVKAIFMNDGSVVIEEFDVGELEYYRQNKNNTMLTYKYPKSSRRQACWDNQIKFAEWVQHPVLLQLKKLMEATSQDALDTAMATFLNKNRVDSKIDVYVSFEVEDAKNTIQSMNTLAEINSLVLKAEGESDQVDVYGNSNVGWEQSFQEIGEFKLYSNNDQNECYSRYGLNGSDAHPMGTSSRQNLADTIRFFTKNHSWYFKHLVKKGKKDKSPYDYRIFTTLFPKDKDPIQSSPYSDEDRLNESDYEEQIKEILEMFKFQINKNPSACGEIFAVRKPKNGALILVHTYSPTFAELARATQRWVDGVYNGQGDFEQLTIVELVNQANNGWKIEHDNGKKKYAYFYKPLCNLQDGYNFFFDDPNAIKKITKAFATFVCPMLIMLAVTRHSEDIKKPYARRFLIPMRNLILHKNDIKEDSFMDHWAYVLGRVFNTADWLYERWYQDREMKVPDVRLGSRYVAMAYNNPKRAYGQFAKEFQPCLNYCKSHLPGLYGHYGKMTKSLLQLIQELPASLSDTERMLLQCGFTHISPKKEQEEIEIEIELQNVADD